LDGFKPADAALPVFIVLALGNPLGALAATLLLISQFASAPIVHVVAAFLGFLERAQAFFFKTPQPLLAFIGLSLLVFTFTLFAFFLLACAAFPQTLFAFAQFRLFLGLLTFFAAYPAPVSVIVLVVPGVVFFRLLFLARSFVAAHSPPFAVVGFVVLLGVAGVIVFALLLARPVSLSALRPIAALLAR
jgi:hypothetical protein